MFIINNVVSTRRYTIFRRIYWVRELLEEKETVLQGKELNTGFCSEVQ